MANKKYEENDIQAIANAIREKAATEDSYKVSEMASGVTEVYDKGYYDALLNWWDNLTLKGKRESYIGTFQETAIGDMVGLEKLPYPAKPTKQCDKMFRSYSAKKLPPKNAVDLTIINKINDNQYVVNSMFSWWNSGTTEGVVPDYGMPAMNFYVELFYASSAIKTIELIRSHENTQYDRTFNGTNRLENIAFEGVIGQNISFSLSPLSVESMKNIILHLNNYAGTSSEYTHTLTLNASAFQALEAEGATANYNGVACTWAELIDNLKWNLVLV